MVLWDSEGSNVSAFGFRVFLPELSLCCLAIPLVKEDASVSFQITQNICMNYGYSTYSHVLDESEETQPYFHPQLSVIGCLTET